MTRAAGDDPKTRVRRAPISIPLAGYTLRGTLFRPEPPTPKRPAILFLHGWASSQQGYLPRAEALSELGFLCLTFNLHGHGESGGERGTPAARRYFLNDALAAYDLLVSQDDVRGDRVGVVGASFGGYLGALLTAKRKVRWLALRAPANYADAELGSGYEALRGFPGELLLIESEKDEVIPHEMVMGYKAALGDDSRARYELLQGASHHLAETTWQLQFIDLLTGWFGSKIQAG